MYPNFEDRTKNAKKRTLVDSKNNVDHSVALGFTTKFIYFQSVMLESHGKYTQYIHTYMISDMKLDIRLLQCNDIQIFDDEFLICGSE